MPRSPLPAAPCPFDRLLQNMGNLLSLVRILSAVIFITFWFTLPTINPLARYFRNSTGFGAILELTMDKFAIFATIMLLVMLASCVLGLRAAYFHSDNVQAHYDKSREFTSH